MMKPDGAGYRGIGPNAGKFVPADEALEYALEQCGVSIIMVDKDAPEAEEFLRMVEEWYFDGGWTFVPADDEGGAT